MERWDWSCGKRIASEKVARKYEYIPNVNYNTELVLHVNFPLGF